MLSDTLIVSRGCGCAGETQEKLLGERSQMYVMRWRSVSEA